MKYVFLVLTFAFFLSGAVAGGYYYFFLIPEKVERRLVESLESLGFDYLSYKDIKKGRGKVTISDISLDEDNFSTIGEISIHFALSQIFFDADQARIIHIKDMHLTGAMSDELSLSFFGLSDNSAFIEKLEYLPAQSILIENGAADLLTDVFGGLKVNYDLQLNRVSEKSFDVVGRLASKQNRLSFHSKISGTLNTDQDSTFKFEAEQISATLPDYKIRRGAASIDYFASAAPTYYADIHLSSLVWRDFPLSGVKGNIKSTPEGHNIDVSGGTFGPASIQWKARTHHTEEAFKTKIMIQPEQFSDMIEFMDLNTSLDTNGALPGFVSQFKKPSLLIETTSVDDHTNGQITLDVPAFDTPITSVFSSKDGLKKIHGTFNTEKFILSEPEKGFDFDLGFSGQYLILNLFQAPVLELLMDTKVSNGAIDYGPLVLGNIKGRSGFNSLQKKQDKKSLSFSLPLKKSIAQNGKIALHLNDASVPLIGSAHFNIYGGAIKTDSSLFRDGALLKENKLVVSDINISQFLKDIGLGKIFISGSLGGILPVKFEESVIKVNGGILQSQAPGILKLPDHITASLFAGDSKKMRNIRAALSNYHYEFFEIRLDGDLAGRAMMTFSARGRNPEMQLKDPVDIKVQIETQISKLFEKLMR